MASRRLYRCLYTLPSSSRPSGLSPSTPRVQSLFPSRHLATESSITTEASNLEVTALNTAVFESSRSSKKLPIRPPTFVSQSTVPERIAPSTVTATIYSFPQLEPQYFTTYPTSHLYLPLRKDLLHKAVIFEGDASRKGLAKTKHRYEIHGSKHKIRPQKGGGVARLGDRSSPMLRGGGRAFPRRPRDFSTDLNQKMYDIAWRTALSYRYRKGQLIIVDRLNFEYSTSWIRDVLDRLQLGKEHGKSLFVAAKETPNAGGTLGNLMRQSNQGVFETMDNVDVKDLLKQGRVVVERRALDHWLGNHQYDLTCRVWKEPSP